MRHTDLCMWLRLRGAPYGLFEYDITFCDSQHRQSFHTLTQTFLWPQLIAALVRFNPQKVQVDPAGPLNQNFQGRGWACDQDTCEKHLPQLPSLVTYREGNEDWAATGQVQVPWLLAGRSFHRATDTTEISAILEIEMNKRALEESFFFFFFYFPFIITNTLAQLLIKC